MTSSDPSWFYNEESYMILARDEENTLIGGIRVHAVGESSPILPMVEAIMEHDNRVFDLVKNYKSKGVGEICGLWVSNKNILSTVIIIKDVTLLHSAQDTKREEIYHIRKNFGEKITICNNQYNVFLDNQLEIEMILQ